MGLRIRRHDFQSFSVMRDRLVHLSFPLQDGAKIVVRIGVVRLDLQGPLIMRDCLVRSPSLEKSGAKIVVSSRVVGAGFPRPVGNARWPRPPVPPDTWPFPGLVVSPGILWTFGHCVAPDGLFAMIGLVATFGRKTQSNRHRGHQNEAASAAQRIRSDNGQHCQRDQR